MNDAMQAKIIEYIDGLASSLGVAAEYVYALLTRQMLTEGIVYSTLFLAVIAALALSARKVFAYCTELSDDYHGEIAEAISVVYVVACVGVAVASFFFLPESIMKIFNPEYYAIKSILDAIGGK